MSSWQPWKDFEPPGRGFVAELDIEEPPCKRCRFWAPRRWYSTNLPGAKPEYLGVQLCHAEMQHRDFSYFEDRENERA